MSSFLGTHQNRIDAKGRVSVPAPFRTEMKRLDGSTMLVLRNAHILPCVEVWPEAEFQMLGNAMQDMDDFSEERTDTAWTYFGDAHRVEADKDGRIQLLDRMIAHAGLSGNAVFVGLGRMMQIWEPAAAETFRLAAVERTLARRAAKEAADAAAKKAAAQKAVAA